jgi:hypothetical protein
MKPFTLWIIKIVSISSSAYPEGFLSTEDKVVPGSMGLKKQPAALHWVMKNTEAFGGNPDTVTLIQILMEEPV